MSNDLDKTCRIPQNIVDSASETLISLPEKSRKRYEMCYLRFKAWCKKKKLNAFAEDVLLLYFTEKSTYRKASSLWSEYSMLKTSLAVKDDVDLKTFLKLTAFLRNASVGYHPEKSKIFTKKQFQRFLSEAPDEKFLMMKVVAIFSIAGACRRDELQQMTVDDIQDTGSVLLIQIPQSDKPRSFVVIGETPIDIYRKYASLRPAHATHNRFFVHFRNGRCYTQGVGMNTYTKIASEVAKYLCLENPSQYTGHCFRRCTAKILDDTGADVMSRRRRARRRVCEEAEDERILEGDVEERGENCCEIEENKQPLTQLICKTNSSISEVDNDWYEETNQNPPNIEITTNDATSSVTEYYQSRELTPDPQKGHHFFGVPDFVRKTSVSVQTEPLVEAALPPKNIDNFVVFLGTELRLIKSAAAVRCVKRKIMELVYGAQENEEKVML